MIYMSDVKEAHDKLPQMTATILGKDMRLDDWMNKMVWGGKAHIDNDTFGGSPLRGGGIGSKASTHEDEYNDNVRTTKPVKINIARQDEDDELPKKKKKRRRKKKKEKKTVTKEDEKGRKRQSRL